MNNISPAVYYSYPAGQSAFMNGTNDFFFNISHLFMNRAVVQTIGALIIGIILYIAWIEWRMDKTK